MKNTKAQIPSRGRNGEEARLNRLGFLESLGHRIDRFKETDLSSDQIKSNIENFIGTIPIPLGLIGPLKMTGQENPVFSALATTEGALVASVNRGAKAISDNGGFRASIERKNMIRTPVFTFETLAEACHFRDWILHHFEAIHEETKKYSRHIRLKNIQPNVMGRDIHLNFNYESGDASGQNSTTTCTWHACNWIVREFNLQSEFKIQSFFLDGNGSSDKKTSHHSIHNGRGTSVICEAVISEKTLNDTLKTSSEEILYFYRKTLPITSYNGLNSPNCNIANVIAGLFVSCGQDIACVHESSVGFLNIESHPDGIYCSLKLPCLVVGTVGGGTHLSAQKQVLEMMGCAGTGKVERFAQLIAGFCLSLEISTISAMASGQFAIAHERLGRNKPVQVINKKEFEETYLQSHQQTFKNLDFVEHCRELNGILTNLSSEEAAKYVGFSKWRGLKDDKIYNLMVKSKSSDQELINTLYRTIGYLDPRLATHFSRYQPFSEFSNSSSRELEVLSVLSRSQFLKMPEIHEVIKDDPREGYIIISEDLNSDTVDVIASECRPDQWTRERFKGTLEAITEAQELLLSHQETLTTLHKPNLEQSLHFAEQMLLAARAEGALPDSLISDISFCIEFLKGRGNQHSAFETVIHNDFNPRNVAVRKNGEICIYDWELCSRGLPQRDSLEFLAFCFQSEHLKTLSCEELLEHQRTLYSKSRNLEISKTKWREMNQIAFANFLTSRFLHYVIGNSLTEYPFVENLIQNSMRLKKEIFDDLV